MFGIDVITSYLLVVAIATLLVAVLIWQTHRTGRTVIVWVAASALGVILGSIGSYAAIRSAGYTVVRAPGFPIPGDAALSPLGMPPPAMMLGGMMPGGMGMMGMGAPQPKQDLATLVRKLDLLTGDITVTLTAQQAAAVRECLQDVEHAAATSDDEAKQLHERLLAVLSEDQKKRLFAIELPRRGGPGGPPGMGGGMMGKGSGGMMSKGGMGGGPQQTPPPNPLQQEPFATALKSLRDKLASQATPQPMSSDAAAAGSAANGGSSPPTSPEPAEKPPEKKSR